MIDPEKRDAAMRLAAHAYRRCGPHPRPDHRADTLLELADLLDRVWELLCPAANVNRLMEAIIEDNSNSAPVPVVHDFMTWVDRYACLARAAHRRRGKPPKNLGLALAYRVLADFWQEQEGIQNFTSGWHKDEEKGDLAPISPAACFLFNALKEIDPDRPRLGEELRNLMSDTVKHLPGPRQGRPELSLIQRQRKELG